MRDHIIRAIINITRDHADIVPLLQGKALEIAMIDRDGIGMKSLERDPREPGLKRKQAAERKIKTFMTRVFERQAESVRMQLAGFFPATKAKTPPVQIDWTDDERDELISLYSGIMDDGVKMFDDEFTIPGADYTFANIEAKKFAKDYSLDLIKNLDDTTREALRSALELFIDSPGATMGDVMASLPFSEARSLRIAVTEVTRAYGQAAQIAGEELKKQFPDLKFYKTWNTNEDDIVCPLCGELDGQVIPLEDEWDDGIMAPPRHVGCRCWINTASEFAVEAT